ncbi:hypothetical protein A9K55_008727 [Cordyceps militaris]|uniref:Uncharacterized protein n=1 Tax=Cordyceps militaris TaxID=73501 RepID=A0A2H4SE76_CORMI|nr:hypothetical protein A9K55_008727 [Cordyceps militaris]
MHKGPASSKRIQSIRINELWSVSVLRSRLVLSCLTIPASRSSRLSRHDWNIRAVKRPHVDNTTATTTNEEDKDEDSGVTNGTRPADAAPFLDAANADGLTTCSRLPVSHEGKAPQPDRGFWGGHLLVVAAPRPEKFACRSTERT